MLAALQPNKNGRKNKNSNLLQQHIIFSTFAQNYRQIIFTHNSCKKLYLCSKKLKNLKCCGENYVDVKSHNKKMFMLFVSK